MGVKQAEDEDRDIFLNERNKQRPSYGAYSVFTELPRS
jgi:hypothetical protein